MVSLALGVGCKKPPPPPTTTDAGPPHDHLAPGEIAEGREKAFSLALPRESRILLKMPNAIQVESFLRPEELSNFVRARVKTTMIAAGADGTTFDQAVVPAEPNRILQIEVRPAQPSPRNARSSMMIRDVTPLPAPPKVSDEEAWKNVGRTPDGKPLDQNHMF